MLSPAIRARLSHLWHDERGVLGTAASIALGIGAIAGSTASSVYGTRAAAGQNRRAIDATERGDTRAAEIERERLAEEKRALDAQLAEARREREAQLAEERRWREEQARLQREEAARKERLYTEAVGRDRERWQDYLRINEPHWRQGSGVLGSLYDIAGFSGQAPGFAPPTQPAQGSTMASGGSVFAPPNTYSSTNAPPSSVLTARGGTSFRGRAFPLMSPPATSSPLSSLSSLMQLANLAGPSRMPLPSRSMDLSRLMTASAL